MQSKCPKCESTSFRMLPESQTATEVQCLVCGHISPFVTTVAESTNVAPKPRAVGTK